MDNNNRELLTEVIADRLSYALDNPGKDEGITAFKHAMEAIDRESRISKDDDTYRESLSKLEMEKEKIEIEKQKIEIEKQKIKIEQEKHSKDDEFKRKEATKVWIYRGIEIAAIYVFAPLLEKHIKTGFAKMCMTWETDNTFTSTPGRSVRDFFKFKK